MTPQEMITILEYHVELEFVRRSDGWRVWAWATHKRRYVAMCIASASGRSKELAIKQVFKVVKESIWFNVQEVEFSRCLAKK